MSRYLDVTSLSTPSVYKDTAVAAAVEPCCTASKQGLDCKFTAYCVMITITSDSFVAALQALIARLGCVRCRPNRTSRVTRRKPHTRMGHRRRPSLYGRDPGTPVLEMTWRGGQCQALVKSRSGAPRSRVPGQLEGIYSMRGAATWVAAVL